MIHRAIIRLRAFAFTAVAAQAIVSTPQAGPIVFEFALPANVESESAFSREIFADVITPAGATIRLPAYVSGRDRWSIHARADQPGEFRIGPVTERIAGRELVVSKRMRSPTIRTIKRPTGRLPVIRAPGDPTRFVLTDNSPFTPIGANLAWAVRPAGKQAVAWHVDALRQFARNELNWTRIWMCHWGGTNLDWLPEEFGRSPEPGRLDPRVAASWDHILDAAEANGVYVQVVLQHHGQYTTGANPNWEINPWNAANPGGFLTTPGEFFTSPRAIALTKQKYRYIVARWAHSPAVMAWELFNEVHWTNAYGVDQNEAAVAAWHTMMAEYIRSIDPYDHLITTSLDDLRSPVYAAMDYYQPHLYAIEMLTSTRRFELPIETFDRPIFYGEIGDDKMPVSDEEKVAGSQLAPQVWAGIMGSGPIPAQSWLGETFLRTRRLGELGAVARFLRSTALATRNGLVSFSPAVEGGEYIPAPITPGHEWTRHIPAEVKLPLDGSDPVSASDIPAFLVGAPDSIAEGFPQSATLRFTLPRDTVATVSFLAAGTRGAAVSIDVDGDEVATQSWPRLPGEPEVSHHSPDTIRRPARLSFPISAGRRSLTIRNTGGVDWVRLGTIDFQLETPVLAAAGKRADDFIALWVWNKRGVHAIDPNSPASSSLLIDNVPSGTWTATWWDSIRGVPGDATTITHAGGTLRLDTPSIARHAAVVLTR